MIVAEISVVPIGEGTSVGKYVRLAVKAIKDSGVKYHVSPMGTCFEVDNLEKALEIAAKAHRAVAGAGAKRIVTTLKIDERLDTAHSMEKKVASATRED
ncbi:MAG: MTH1187 family thiamine-binding protein [Thermoplasmata archaeon]|nr:MTH1187 family thiamine-binding protein [Thermoplasmata archaeon]